MHFFIYRRITLLHDLRFLQFCFQRASGSSGLFKHFLGVFKARSQHGGLRLRHLFRLNCLCYLAGIVASIPVDMFFQLHLDCLSLGLSFLSFLRFLRQPPLHLFQLCTGSVCGSQLRFSCATFGLLSPCEGCQSFFDSSSSLRRFCLCGFQAGCYFL